jgi:hypothetical protein
MSQAQPAVPAPVPEKRSVLAVLIDVFFEPKRAFEQVKHFPRWWFPLALSIVAMFVYMSVFSSRVGWDQFMRQTLESNQRMQELPREQREQIIEQQSKFMRAAGNYIPIVTVLVATVVIAAVLLFVFRNLLDGRATFSQVVGVVTWAGMPGLLVLAASFAVLLLKDPSEFDLENPVGFNLGFYLPEGTAPWLRGLGSSIDIFSFWSILLVATGMSVVTRKSWSSSLMGVVLPWAAYVILKTGWSAMFG